MVNRLSTMLETWVQSLGREDPLEKEMETHSSTIAWKILWTDGLPCEPPESMLLKKVNTKYYLPASQPASHI